jgi:hypothetical protein
MSRKRVVKASAELSPLSQRSSAQKHVNITGTLGSDASFAERDNLKAKMRPLACPSMHMSCVTIHVTTDNVGHPILLHDTVNEGMSPGGMPHVPVNARNGDGPMWGNVGDNRGRSSRMITVVPGRCGGLHLKKLTPENHDSPRSALLVSDLSRAVASIVALKIEDMKEGVHIFLDVFGLL